MLPVVSPSGSDAFNSVSASMLMGFCLGYSIVLGYTVLLLRLFVSAS